MMYGKIFSSMYDGSLPLKGWEAIITFQQMIVLADRYGIVDITPQALAARTSIPLEIIQRGIAALQEPDDMSRSSAEEGRRIVLLDPSRSWGWRIVNHRHYQDLINREDKRIKDAQRIADKRKEISSVALCRNLSQESQMSQIVANVASSSVSASASANTEDKEKKTPLRGVKEKAHFGEFENVFLNEDEIQKLHERFGKPQTQSSIESLSQYLAKTGKKYKSHYATLLSWDRMSYSSEPQQRPSQKKETPAESFRKRMGAQNKIIDTEAL